MNFFDTSVIIAAAQTTSDRYAASSRLIDDASRRNAACSLHSLAEIYAVLSGMPRPYRLPQDAALQIVEQTREIMQIITLTEKEYATTIASLGNTGLIGGIVYDALLMQCARKANAKHIYSWNARHFKLVAPDLASIISTP
ncbi:MAG: PIN domain-containing protein [Acidobacteriota bacterium]